ADNGHDPARSSPAPVAHRCGFAPGPCGTCSTRDDPARISLRRYPRISICLVSAGRPGRPRITLEPSLTPAWRGAPPALPTGQSVRVAKADIQLGGSQDDALLALFRAIASRDDREVARRLKASPDLAICPIHIGATRDYAKTYFLTPIHHYVYSGDTALHMSAAAHQRQLAQSLVRSGADVRARNRRGAEPLHYAADGGPGANGWDPVAQH